MKFDSRAVYEIEVLNKCSDGMLGFLGERLKTFKEHDMVTKDESELFKNRMLSEAIGRVEELDKKII